MVKDFLYPLRCGVQHYDWGARADNDKQPYIAELVGDDPNDKPYAELWIGAHPKLPASVLISPTEEKTLSDFIAADQEAVLGKPLLANGIRILPFLLKVLDCRKNLSIQAHPDKQLAEKLHAEDPENYPDDNHKPEIAVSICGMEAFCQFRPVTEIKNNLLRLNTLAEAFADFLAGDGICDESPEKWLRQVYTKLFDMPQERVERLLVDLRQELEKAEKHELSDKWVHELLTNNPGDRGVLNAYFLNIIYLEEGEAVFLAANEPHAYLRGTIIECMANSDNVVRAGLTSKFVDQETLVNMLSFRGMKPEKTRGEEQASGVRVYKVPAPEFQVEMYTGEKSSRQTHTADDMISLMLVLEGGVQFSVGDRNVSAQKGSAWLWPASVPECDITFTEHNTCVVRARPNTEFFSSRLIHEKC
ncbi:MAG: mannose-6-phosphate isomerase, class I [Verrucomicrobiota bacterium]